MTSSEPGLQRARLLARLAVPAGECADCRHLKLADSARSVFVRCLLADEDDRFRRYPPLPVRHCPGHEPIG
jgi:hypothetical protein